MMFAKLLALLAIVAMASAECTSDPLTGGSTTTSVSGKSGKTCYFSDTKCATADNDICAKYYEQTTVGCKNNPSRCTGVTYSGCSGGCWSATKETATLEATASAEVTTAGHDPRGPGHNQMPPHDETVHGNHGSESHSDSGSGPFGGLLDAFSAEERKELGLGGKGDQCKGFKIWLAVRAVETKCEAFDAATDPATACKAGGCEYECTAKRWVSGKETCLKFECRMSEAEGQKAMGINLEQLQAKAMAKNRAGMTEAEGRANMMSVMKEVVPVFNAVNTTMLEIEKFSKRCNRTTATCTGDNVCELQMDYNESTANYTQTCSVAKAKAVAEIGCGGVAKAVAAIDAAERKAVADGAKKFLEGKKTDLAAKAKKLKEAKQALADAKLAGKDTTDLEKAVGIAAAGKSPQVKHIARRNARLVGCVPS